jgi:prevent-host-death family protein
MVMKKMPAGEFKAHCLKVMDRVEATREPVVITKNGRPVAKLVPVEAEAKDFLGCLAGVIEIVGDIESPVEPPEAWEVLR